MCSTVLSLKWFASVLSLLIGFIALYLKFGPSVFITKALFTLWYAMSNLLFHDISFVLSSHPFFYFSAIFIFSIFSQIASLVHFLCQVFLGILIFLLERYMD